MPTEKRCEKRTEFGAPPARPYYDVLVIGAGALGCAVARELSRYELRVAVLEKNSDVAGETTGRNSAVVHAGFNNRPGSSMARFCVEGNEGFEELCRELDVPYRRTGKLVVAFDETDRESLEELLARGRENGCRDLRILEGEELQSLLRERGMAPGGGQSANAGEGHFAGAPGQAADSPSADAKAHDGHSGNDPDQATDSPAANQRNKRAGNRFLAALWSPRTAITNPFLYCVALAENAQANGADFFLDTEVTDIKILDSEVADIKSGSGRNAHSTNHSPDKNARFFVTTRQAGKGSAGPIFSSTYLINCTGLHADRIAAMAGMPPETYRIYPCRGEYCILDKMPAGSSPADGNKASDTPADFGPPNIDPAGSSNGSENALLPMPIYPAPRKHAGGLGVHLTPTIEGNIIIGPSAEYLEDPAGKDRKGPVLRGTGAGALWSGFDPRTDYACTRPVMDELMKEARQLMPEAAALQPIGNYAGVRPKQAPPGEGGYYDFVIRAEEEVPGLIDLIGIESPGLTASVPIAREVCRLIDRMERDRAKAGAAERTEASAVSADAGLKRKAAFCGRRQGILRFRDQTAETQQALIEADPAYGEIICRCQQITRREICQAIENPLGAVSISAIKYRAWATTGRCNGGYCLPRIVKLLIDDYSVAPEDIQYRNSGSEMFTGRVK